MVEPLKQFSNRQNPSKEMILKDVSYSWKPGTNALRNCTLSIPFPGLWMLVGGNGSGKSTLFRLISGLITPQQGQFFCSFKPSLLLQNPDHQLLLPTCASDLLLSLPSNLNAKERNERIQHVLNQVGLEEMTDRPIHTLSGGQKQRLALAGALLSQADLLLLDEPTALLDPKSQKSILEIVRNIASNTNKHPITALWITHRLEELTYCDGAAIMEQGSLGQWFPGSEVITKLT
ncbi:MULTISPECIES: energy-coupling factor ABC transporter ATP-binding protein [unclassified Prochlorococcus]|uniref:energy-coupling factor ABC transporter ATP-binding protein n=1 Tax=unclassified Prochlorococcus TaxID=2627481 RepID=UPI00053399BE|nr:MULTISPECIES: ABC transporter ATP-binding protein [unclassified Prochlorococcus]KGG16812.1 putative ABC transporter [Prochlorococcus sp. MIT 0602]KGG18214.1 putative ABC transporter [Prochlorococcus sp. MIT 0603]